MADEQQLLMTIRDVADAVQISESNSRRLIADGHIRAVRIGRCLRVTREALEEYVPARLVLDLVDQVARLSQDRDDLGWHDWESYVHTARSALDLALGGETTERDIR